MANRKKILPGFLLDKKHSTDLYGEVLRETVAGKRFDGPEFFAKVLSAPYPMDPVAVTDFFPAPGLRTTTEESIMPKAELEAKYAKLRDKPSKFSFFGRIESQHKMLPEPSPLTFATAPQLTLDAVKRHTEFISTFDAEPPTPGDLVIVRLREGDNGWNLQHGEYIELFEPGWDPEYAEAQFTAVMDKGISDALDQELAELDAWPTDEEIAAGAEIHKAFEEALAEEAAGTITVQGPEDCLPTNPIPCYQVGRYNVGKLEQKEDGTWQRLPGDHDARAKGNPDVFSMHANNWQKGGISLATKADLKYIVIHNTAGKCVNKKYYGPGPAAWTATNYRNEAYQSLSIHYVLDARNKNCKGPAGKLAYSGCPGYIGWHYGVDQNGNIAQGVLDQDSCNVNVGLNETCIGIETNGSPWAAPEDFKLANPDSWIQLWGDGDEAKAIWEIEMHSRSHEVTPWEPSVRCPGMEAWKCPGYIGKHCQHYKVTTGGNYNFKGTGASGMGMYNDGLIDTLAKLIHDLCMKYNIPIQKGNEKTGTPGILGHDETADGQKGAECKKDPYKCRKTDPGTFITLNPGGRDTLVKTDATTSSSKTFSGNGYVGAAFDWDNFLERVSSYGTSGAALAAFGAATDEETATG